MNNSSHSSDILLFDGMFIQRPETREYFASVIYLKTEPAVALSRAIARDAALLGSPEDIARIHARRYDPAQLLYDSEAQPETRANIVIDNAVLDAPVLHRVRSVRT